MSDGASLRLSTPRRDELRTGFAITVWSFLTLIAVVLIGRRVSGAFQTDIGSAAPCIAATIAVLLSLIANAVWCTVNAYGSSRKQIVAAALTLLPPLTIGCALWTSHSTSVGGYLGGLGLIAAVATVAISDLSPGAGSGVQAVARAVQKESPCCPKADQGRAILTDLTEVSESVEPATTSDCHSESPIEEFVDDEAEEFDPSILQSMTRRLLDDGTEAVEGSVRIYFGPGERTAAAHVAFTPPLSDRPRVECQALSDFGGRVRIGVAQSYGLRIEARRAEPARDAVCVDVGFSTQVAKAQSAAA
ncbi:MAG TPA: hypothetical protein VHX68_17525 [Planctomycetaceae bacterium]|nr:hypothetical protein [Planctomycetaceae bacterium]